MRRLSVVVSLGVFGTLSAACDVDPDCAEGTVEVDGVCMAPGEDTDASDESGTASTGGEPYQACPAESDVQCASDETCVELTHACAQACTGDTDCPGPSDGTSVQRCEGIEVDPGAASAACVLYCGGGLVCPEGMSCEATTLISFASNETLEICTWN